MFVFLRVYIPIYYSDLIGCFCHLWVFGFVKWWICNSKKSLFIRLERFTDLYKHLRCRGEFNTNYWHIIPSFQWRLVSLCYCKLAILTPHPLECELQGERAHRLLHSAFFQLLIFLLEALLVLYSLNPLAVQSLRVSWISSLTANEKTRSFF